MTKKFSTTQSMKLIASGHWHGMGHKWLERIAAEAAAEIEWLETKPQEDCDSKCEYGKRGDPNGCYCGRAEWIARRPEHLSAALGHHHNGRSRMAIENIMEAIADALPATRRTGRSTTREVCLTRYGDGTWRALAGGHPAVHIGEFGGDYAGDGDTAEAALLACMQDVKAAASHR